MKKIFVITVYGEMTAGVMKSLARRTSQADAEWITSKVIHVDHHFTALLKIAVDENVVGELKASLEQEFTQLNFVFEPTASMTLQRLRTVNFNVDCKDRAGLIRDIVDMLVDQDLSIGHMEFNRVHVSNLGEAVFTAKLTLQLPTAITNESVVELLEEVGEEMRVAIL